MERMMVGWPEKATDEDKGFATAHPLGDLNYEDQLVDESSEVRSVSSTGGEKDVPARAAVLNEAAQLITGDRNNQYGPPTQDFRRTADALTAMGYRRLDTDEKTTLPLVPSDVAIMVGMVKTSRLMHSRSKRDNWVDVAGYAGCGYECAVEEERG